MMETHRIARLFQEALEGSPYYGPSLLATLNKVDSELAARQQPSGHSIWELVAHMTAEMNYACAMLEGDAGPWVEGETTWPQIVELSQAGWARTIEDLRFAYRELLSRIRTLDEERLDQREPMPVERSIYDILHGTLQHNVYHTGQISLLLKAAGH